MKILHIVDNLGLGGAQTILKGVLEVETSNNHYLFVLRKTDIVIDIKHSHVYIYPSYKKFSLAPIKELKKIIEKENIEILHCHLFRSQLFGWLAKKRYFTDIKLVFHEHGRVFINQTMYKLFLKISKSHVDKYLAVSKATKNYLINNANITEKKIMVLYNFVDLNKYESKNVTWNTKKEREKLSIAKDAFVVGFAGRLVKRKGWRTFIDAVEFVSYEIPNAKFLIAGDGIDKTKLLQLIDRKQLNKNVKYIGYISNMIWFYSLLNCFVIPSHWEPMGLTEIEAQALGIPVIVSNVEALNEIITDQKNGLFFEAGNKQDLAEKIIEIFINNDFRKMIVNEGHSNVRKYSLDKYLINLNTIYECL